MKDKPNSKTISPEVKKEISRSRSDVRKLKLAFEQFKKTRKDINPFTGYISGNYWTQTGMPWVSGEGRKAVLTEYFWQPIRGQPRRVDTNELRQFSQTFWISACVKTIMDEITSLEWDIVPKDGYDYDWVEEGIEEVKKFFNNPNHNNESFSTIIIRAFIKDILELDAGVLVKVFDINSYDFNEIEPKSGAPMLKPIGQRKMTEIYARDGASFLKEIDKFGFLKGYWQYSYQIPAHPMWFNREEIVYTTEHPRSMSTYGYARTQAILDIIKSLHYSTLYNKRFFEETAIPDGALALLDTNEEEMKNFLNWWNGEFKAQPHKVAVINKDIKWQPFATSNRELEFLETQKSYFSWVISMFGLTPAELGITEDLNKSTAATQAEVAKRKGIRPFLKVIENAVNRGIMPEFQYEGIEFQFIYDDPAEKAARLDNWTKELSMGVKTINEVRVEMGMDPIEGGDRSNTMMDRFMFSQSPEERTEETQTDSQTPGYEENLDREQADNEAKTRKIESEVRDKIKNPYSPTNRPMGNFKEKEMPGGLADNRQPSDFDPESLEQGTKVEMEHTDDPKVAQEIAMDHLAEDPMYYVKLREMESKMKEKKANPKLQEIHDALVREGAAEDPWALAQWIYQNISKSTEKRSQEEKWQSCVEQVRSRGGVGSPEAVCTVAVGHPMKGVEKAENERERQNKWHEMFYALQREGHSQESAARIATSRMGSHSDTARTEEDHARTYEHLTKCSCETHKGYVAPVGAYYNDQPMAMPRRPSGADYQPQNPLATNNFPMDSSFDTRHPRPEMNPPGYGTDLPSPYDHTDIIPSHMGGSFARPGVDDFRYPKDNIHCPICGQPTLAVLNALEGDLPDDIRCTQCGSRFRTEELLNAKMLEEISNVLAANNETTPVSIPAWRVKSTDKSDLDLSVKEYCGIDTSKSLQETASYVASNAYKRLIDKYLSDLSQRKRNILLSILKNSMRSSDNIRDIALKIDEVIGDKMRSELIARTELIRISNEGNLERMENKGVDMVKFIASPEDGRRCPVCASKDGEIMTLDKAKGTLPVHPRCRCLYTEYYPS